MSKRKQRQHTRDPCSNCKSSAHRNPTGGHVQKFCAFAGGPFAAPGFKAAALAARAEGKRKRTQRAAVAQPTTESQFDSFEHSAQLFFEENIDGDDATEQLQAAQKGPLQIVIKQLKAFQNKQMDDSTRIRELEEQVSGYERDIITLTNPMRSTPQGTVHDVRSRGQGY
jgi:hypothetical protein